MKILRLLFIISKNLLKTLLLSKVIKFMEILFMKFQLLVLMTTSKQLGDLKDWQLLR